MWIPLTLTSAAFQASWMALSKRRLQDLSPTRFMLFLRIPMLIVMLALLSLTKWPEVSTVFWGVVFIVSGIECVRVLSLAYGVRRDYYATFSLFNTAPIFVLILSPWGTGESLTARAVAGVLCVVCGGLVFYRAGRFQPAGLVAAIAQGSATALNKLGLSLSTPLFYMATVFTVSTLLLFLIEMRTSRMGDVLRNYRGIGLRTLPLSVLNLCAVAAYMLALNRAEATHFAVVLRSSLVFGFILSLLVLHERGGWRAKLAGSVFILIGSVLIIWT